MCSTPTARKGMVTPERAGLPVHPSVLSAHKDPFHVGEPGHDSEIGLAATVVDIHGDARRVGLQTEHDREGGADSVEDAAYGVDHGKTPGDGGSVRFVV